MKDVLGPRLAVSIMTALLMLLPTMMIMMRSQVADAFLPPRRDAAGRVTDHRNGCHNWRRPTPMMRPPGTIATTSTTTTTTRTFVKKSSSSSSGDATKKSSGRNNNNAKQKSSAKKVNRKVSASASSGHDNDRILAALEESSSSSSTLKMKKVSSNAATAVGLVLAANVEGGAVGMKISMLGEKVDDVVLPPGTTSKTEIENVLTTTTTTTILAHYSNEATTTTMTESSGPLVVKNHPVEVEEPCSRSESAALKVGSAVVDVVLPTTSMTSVELQQRNGSTLPTAATGSTRSSNNNSNMNQHRPQQPRFAQQKHQQHSPPTTESLSGSNRGILEDYPARVFPATGFNVVLTHCTADFDSLASAVGLAKLWSIEQQQQQQAAAGAKKAFDAPSHVPTFVILPRGAHPGVQRFLGLHKHLFPIRSLKSLLQSECVAALHRLALVDAQRRDRLGPAEPLLSHADHITVVDHHMDQDSDIPATDFVVEPVGSVSTIISERLQAIGRPVLSHAEATLLALGIHADTGSLCFDSTTPRDAAALAWLLSQGASQAAIAEHAQSCLSAEQQGVLMQALVNANTTVVQGVTVSTVLLQSDGFISGLAAVTEDALDLSSSDVLLFGLVYQAKPGGSRRNNNNNGKDRQRMTAQKLGERKKNTSLLYAEAWQGGEVALRRRRLSQAFQRNDSDGSGFLEKSEVAAALAGAGVLLQVDTVQEVMNLIDVDGDGRIDFDEFVEFATKAEEAQNQKNNEKGTTMILIGRVRAGINVKSVKLNTIMERFGGGGHAKAASATVRLNDESEAEGILRNIVDEIVNTSLKDQPLVRDFMTSPVLTAHPDMTETQLDDMFSRYNVRAFPVVDKQNILLGIVSFQLVADAKQRLKNKIERSIRMKTDAPKGSAVKGWMLQHVQTVEEDKTMAEVENILLEHDVGCIPVVEVGTKKLVGMVTRTDVLRQHRYYAIPYHNKGFADSIAARKPIIELRKRLKKFDLDE